MKEINGIYYDRELLLSNGNTQYFKEVDDTCFEVALHIGKDNILEDYSNTVNDKLIYTLLSLMKSKRRVRIWQGDTKTGRAWIEDYDIMGTIGRSCGNYKIPILINNKRSYGGLAILVGSIIRIDDIKSRTTLFQVDNFHVEPFSVEYKDESYPYRVMQTKDDGTIQNVANFKTELQAYKWVDFMTGKRYAK